MATTIRRATAAEWTSANPVLAVGARGYETNTPRYKIGDGSTAWTSLAYAAGNCVESGYAEQVADQSVTSSTATVATTMAFTAYPHSVYLINGHIFCDGATTGDIRIGVSVPSGGSVLYEAIGPIATISSFVATAVTQGLRDESAISTFGTAGVGGVKSAIRLMARLTTAATVGDFAVRFAQSVSDATATTVYADSYITFQKVR